MGVILGHATFKQMSELMDRLLREKLLARRRLAALPFEEKIELMQKIRERNRSIAEHPLRVIYQEPTVILTILGSGSPVTSRIGVSRPRAYYQFPSESNTPQSSASAFAKAPRQLESSLSGSQDQEEGSYQSQEPA
jgi:hypothetical protein